MGMRTWHTSVYGCENTARECFEGLGKRQTNETLIFQANGKNYRPEAIVNCYTFHCVHMCNFIHLQS